jgi:hypothetical protein
MRPIKRVLSLGINDFGNRFESLNGCINDVKLGYKIWKEVYGFSEFKIYTDEKATKRNLRKGLDWLVNEVPPKSTLVLQISTHGTNVPCTSETLNDEIDGLDECIVVYDFDFKNPLRDNELGNKFKLLDPSIHIMVFLDTCMSGGSLRGCVPKNMKNRHVKPPPGLMLESGQIDIGDDLEYLTEPLSKQKRGAMPFLINTIDQGNAILLSACGEHQFAADTYISNRYHGLFTFITMQTLKEANWNITYKKLMTIVNEKMTEAGFEDQVPQCECENCFDKLFLGGK